MKRAAVMASIDLTPQVPLDDVATLCRALGYYPTEREVGKILWRGSQIMEI